MAKQMAVADFSVTTGGFCTGFAYDPLLLRQQLQTPFFPIRHRLANFDHQLTVQGHGLGVVGDALRVHGGGSWLVASSGFCQRRPASGRMRGLSQPEAT